MKKASLLLVFSLGLFANGVDFSYLEANKSKYTELVKEKFEHLDLNVSKKITKDTEEITRFDSKTLQAIYPKEYQKIIDKIKLEHENDSKKYMTVFWLFSTNTSDKAVESFMALGKKLKDKYPNFQYYGVLRGFPKNMSEYPNKFLNKDGYNDFRVKIHPMIYRKLNVKKVPAYALAFCPKGNFSYKQCDFEYLVRGDMALDGFFQIVSDEDKRYKRFYFDLIDAK